MNDSPAVVLYDAAGNPIVSATAHPTGAERGYIVRNIERTAPTFLVLFDRIAPAANKYMATLFNTSSTRNVVIQRIWVYNWQITSVTGVLLEQELRRITARTAGTSVTPIAYDDGDTLSAGITADHLSTAVTDGDMFARIMATSEEVFLSSNAFMLGGRVIERNALVYERKPGTRGIVCRNGKGVTIKNTTSSTVGTVSYAIEFTDEEA